MLDHASLGVTNIDLVVVSMMRFCVRSGLCASLILAAAAGPIMVLHRAHLVLNLRSLKKPT